MDYLPVEVHARVRDTIVGLPWTDEHGDLYSKLRERLLDEYRQGPRAPRLNYPTRQPPEDGYDV